MNFENTDNGDWLRSGIKGGNLVAVLKLYLWGTLMIAPFALISLFVFDSESAFFSTLAFVVAVTGAGFIAAYRQTAGNSTRQSSLEPVPWVPLLPDETDPGHFDNPSTEEAKKLSTMATYALIMDCNWPVALDLYEKSLLFDSSIAETWSNKAIALWETGRLPAALACINQALAISPNSAGIWLNRGIASWRLGLEAKASGFLKRALEIEPRLSTSVNSNGDDLEIWFRNNASVLSKSPDTVQMWRLKGELLLSLGRNREAKICFDVASKLEASKILAAA